MGAGIRKIQLRRVANSRRVASYDASICQSAPARKGSYVDNQDRMRRCGDPTKGAEALHEAAGDRTAITWRLTEGDVAGVSRSRNSRDYRRNSTTLRRQAKKTALAAL